MSSEMTLYIEDLKFRCIIGILDFERSEPQDVIVNLKINYDYKDEFLNYVDISKHVKKQMIGKKFLLIEDALNSLETTLKENFPQITTLFLKVTKPSILSDCKVSLSIQKTYNS